MTRHLLAFACGLGLACSVAAQEPKEKPAPSKGAATKRAVEDVEVVEAHLRTKMAYVRAAMVAVQAAEWRFDRVSKLAQGASGLQSQAEVDDAKLALEAAKAQLEIREAEANEVAVRLKHAKRRAEEAQKADALEAPRLRAAREKMQADLQVAKSELKLAESELERQEKLYQAGVGSKRDLDTARERRRLADFRVQQVEKELAGMETPAPKAGK